MSKYKKNSEELAESLQKAIDEALDNPTRRILVASEASTPIAEKAVLSPNRPRLFFCIEGCREITFSERGCIKTESILEGDIFFANRYAWHRSDDKAGSQILCLIVDDNHFEITWKRHFQNSFDESDTDYILQRCYPTDSIPCRLMKIIDDVCVQPDGDVDLTHLATTCVELVKNLLDNPGNEMGKAFKTYLAILDHIGENFSKSPVTRSSVAREMRITPTHISKLFKKFRGEGFTAYLVGLKMEDAKRMMKTHGLLVSEAADRCGFNNPNYFSKAFRRHFGISPSEYQATYE